MNQLNKTPKQALIFGSLNHVLSDFLSALMIPILILLKDDPNLGINYTNQNDCERIIEAYIIRNENIIFRCWY